MSDLSNNLVEGSVPSMDRKLVLDSHVEHEALWRGVAYSRLTHHPDWFVQCQDEADWRGKSVLSSASMNVHTTL